MPAANMVSSVFLDRRGPDFDDPEALLRGIHEEMNLIKRLRLGFTFIFSTAICRRLPGGLEKRIRADKCTISCILTNVGAPFAHIPLDRRGECVIAGNVTLEDLQIAVPVRPYSCVTFAVALYARRLGVTLHYDPRPLSADQATDLLETYVRQIKNSIAVCYSALECVKHRDVNHDCPKCPPHEFRRALPAPHSQSLKSGLLEGTSPDSESSLMAPACVKAV